MTIILPEWILIAVAAYLYIRVAIDVTKIVLKQKNDDKAWGMARDKQFAAGDADK